VSGGRKEQEDEQARLRRLAELKSYLSDRLTDLENELEFLRMVSEMVDRELVRKSFKRAEVTPPPPPRPEEATLRRIVGKTGQLLATMTVSNTQARITFNPEIKVLKDTRPFASFFLGRVLDQMVSADSRKAEEGRIDRSSAMSYEVVYDGDLAREVIIRNYVDEQRLREITNAAKWTLDTIAAASR